MADQSCEIQIELQKKSYLVIQEGKCICMKGKERIPRPKNRCKKNSYSFTREIREVVLDFNN